MEIEWAANGDFEGWTAGLPRLFHVQGGARVGRAAGRVGWGVEVEGGAVYQAVETILGVDYVLSVYHRGGKASLSLSEAPDSPVLGSLTLGESASFEGCSLRWRATVPRVCLVLRDEADGRPSVFDDLSFTTPGFEEEGAYQFVTNGGFEFWRRTGGVLMPADAWRMLGSAEVAQVESFEGRGVQVEAEGPESGLQQFMAIERGVDCVLSLYHRGGPARVALTANETGEAVKTLDLGESEEWRAYSAEWTSTTDSVCLRLIDLPDGKPSSFDGVSLTRRSTGPSTHEPPINVVFVLHVEPMTRSPERPSTPEMYGDWRGTVLWLKEVFEEYGQKITALFNGEYMEYVVDLGHEDEIRGLIRDGHEVGSHIHGGYREAPHRWRSAVDRGRWEDSLREWDTTVECVERVIPHSKNHTVCAVVNRRHERRLMARHGFKTCAYSSSGLPPGPGEGWRGRCDLAYPYIGHNQYFPYRPGERETPGEELVEDLRGPFVDIPYYAQISRELTHGHHGRLADFQRYFLNTYRAWRSKESTPEPEGGDKVWVYGWLTHAGSRATDEATEEDIEKMLSWLRTNFLGKKTPRGNVIARPATLKEVYDEFLQWEREHPGQSSFSYVHPEEEAKRAPLGGPRPRGLPTELSGRVRELQGLLRERRSQGYDVSEAVKLDSRSREAARAGDPEEALRLLGQAIELLKKPAKH